MSLIDMRDLYNYTLTSLCMGGVVYFGSNYVLDYIKEALGKLAEDNTIKLRINNPKALLRATTPVDMGVQTDQNDDKDVVKRLAY